MSGGFKNKPKILRGAFVEYGLSIPPLFVVFQFNPVQLSRSRTINHTVPNAPQTSTPAPTTTTPTQGQSQSQTGQTSQTSTTTSTTTPQQTPLRDWHKERDDLLDIRDGQKVTIQEETIGFDIRLDATDKLNDGDAITEQFGIAPQIATLELMVHPKSESILGGLVDALLGSSSSFSFTDTDKPPMILFIWGRKRVIPVNISTLNITETEFSTDLNPIRATVAVSMKVIEGPNFAYKYTKAMKEVMSVLNLANIADIADVVIPG